MVEINRNRYARLLGDDLDKIGRTGDIDVYREKHNELDEVIRLNNECSGNIQYYEDPETGHIKYVVGPNAS